MASLPGLPGWIPSAIWNVSVSGLLSNGLIYICLFCSISHPGYPPALPALSTSGYPPAALSTSAPPADWNARLEQGYQDCLQKRLDHRKQKHFPYYTFRKPRAHNYDRRTHGIIMDRLGQEFQTRSVERKQTEAVQFMDWRERKIWEFANQRFFETQKWAKGESGRRAALLKFDKACREIKEKEMDKLELLWKKGRRNSI